MQGLNFNLDPSYIPYPAGENRIPQTSEISRGTVSFLEMVRSEVKMNEESRSQQISRAPEKSQTEQETSEYRKTDDTAAAEQRAEKNTAASASDSEKKTETASSNRQERGDGLQNGRIAEAENSEQNKITSKTPSLVSSFEKPHVADSVKKSARFSEKNAKDKTAGVKPEQKENASFLQAASKPEFAASEKNSGEDLNQVKSVSKENSFRRNERVKPETLADESENEILLSAISASEKAQPALKNGGAKAKVEKENEDLIVLAKHSKEKKSLSDVFSVTDLRTQKAENAHDVKKNDFVTSIKQTDENSVQMTMDLSAQAEKNILSLDSQTAAANGFSFQRMLENQIAENSADFVKAGNIILKDNDVGKINLVLHPETLGNVRISLEVSDKLLTGKIVVASQEAYKAFNSTAENLKAAFIESGFEGANFDISYASQGQNFTGGRGENQNMKYAQAAYDNFVAENISVGENNSDTIKDVQNYSVDVVA